MKHGAALLGGKVWFSGLVPRWLWGGFAGDENWRVNQYRLHAAHSYLASCHSDDNDKALQYEYSN